MIYLKYALVGIVFPLFFGFLRTILSVKYSESEIREYNINSDLKRFKKIESFSGIGLIINWSCITFLLYFISININATGIVEFEKSIIIYPNTWYYIISSIFIATPISFLATEKIIKLVLKHDYKYYDMYYMEKHGNLRSIGILIVTAIGVLGITGYILLGNWSIQFQEEQIVYDELTPFSLQTFQKNEIVQIIQKETNSKSKNPDYIILIELKNQTIEMPDFNHIKETFTEIAENYNIPIELKEKD